MSQQFSLDATIQTAIVAWIHSRLPDFTILWAYPNATDSTLAERPIPPFVELVIKSHRNPTQGVDEDWVSTDTFNYSAIACLNLQINVYAISGHMALVQDIRKSVYLPTVQQMFQSAGMSFWSAKEPIDLSAAEGGKYELRAQIEMEISYIQNIQDSPGQFDTVKVEGTFSNGMTTATQVP